MQDNIFPGGMSEHHVTILIPGTDTKGQMALVQTIEMRGSEPPCHRHVREDKLMYVVAGTLAIYLKNTWLSTPTGAAVWIPRCTDHTFAVMTGEARVLSAFMPAGFEEFYSEAGNAAPWMHTNTQEVERLVARAARYACEITGPHPGKPDAADQAQLTWNALSGYTGGLQRDLRHKR
jgi:quercetin dioxygenase-like cupin family protein